jgi:Domain of unknown function (DUF4157)
MKAEAQQTRAEQIVQPKAEKQAGIASILSGYGNAIQRNVTDEEEPLQKKANDTGLPDNLKSGIENISGHSMDDVQVHYNSARPAQLQAHAYAQGTDIHIAPGQEKHLPHEAWHVVQQKQGRVKPTIQMKRVNVNDDPVLEKEADVMGSKALDNVPDRGNIQPGQRPMQRKENNYNRVSEIKLSSDTNIVQRQDIDLPTAEAAMLARAKDFHALPHIITTPWGDEEGGSNCHGYTVTGNIGSSIMGSDLLGRLGDNSDGVMIFVKDGTIWHSGRFDGTILTHFLIGVGIVRSTIGESLAGYDNRFILPAQQQELDNYLRVPQSTIDKAELAFLRGELYSWEDKHIGGAQQLRMRSYRYEDAPIDDSEELASLIRDMKNFMRDNPLHGDGGHEEKKEEKKKSTVESDPDEEEHEEHEDEGEGEEHQGEEAHVEIAEEEGMQGHGEEEIPEEIEEEEENEHVEEEIPEEIEEGEEEEQDEEEIPEEIEEGEEDEHVEEEIPEEIEEGEEDEHVEEEIPEEIEEGEEDEHVEEEIPEEIEEGEDEHGEEEIPEEIEEGEEEEGDEEEISVEIEAGSGADDRDVEVEFEEDES